MKSKADNNFHLQLRDGEFPMVTKRIEGVPNKLTPTQRRQYQPYLNVNDERGVVGTLDVKDLLRLRLWMDRVGIK